MSSVLFSLKKRQKYFFNILAEKMCHFSLLIILLCVSVYKQEEEKNSRGKYGTIEKIVRTLKKYDFMCIDPLKWYLL